MICIHMGLYIQKVKYDHIQKLGKIIEIKIKKEHKQLYSSDRVFNELISSLFRLEITYT